ncbi:MAG: HPP family protein [Thermoanaerobaculia bacterium]
MKQIPVREFMQRNPTTARADMQLTELVSLFRQEGRRGLPVADEGNRLVGVISETDLFLKEHPVPFSTEKVPSLLGQVIDEQQVNQVERCKEMKVGEVMTETTVSVDEETTLEETALLMYKRRLSMVPVVKDGLLSGVVRRSDILAILYRGDD